MKQVFILVFTTEAQKPTGFFDRREMMLHEAAHLNEDLSGLVWVNEPNHWLY